MKRLERLYAVAEELRRRAPAPVSAQVLAERFGVTRRTMERDLAALRDAGVPLYAESGRTGGYSVLGDGRAVFNLSSTEVTALLIAVAFAGTAPYGDAARAASQRLLDALPDATRVSVDQLVARIRAGESDRPSAPSRILSSIEEAVRRQLVINIGYLDGEGEQTDRAVEAVGFYTGGDGWYLIGWCRLRQGGRLFRIDRIQSARLTKETFTERDVDETLGFVPRPTSAPG